MHHPSDAEIPVPKLAQVGPVLVLALRDDALRARVATTLRGDGLHVIAACDGSELERALRSHEGAIDAVIAENRLDGRWAIECLEGHEGLRGALLETDGDPQLARRAQRYGFELRAPMLDGDELRELAIALVVGPRR